MGEDLPPGAERFFATAGPGSRVAGYVLEEQIGAGGMAVVFRAVDERLGRRVALKVMTPLIAADQVFRQRFIKESRALAAVDDPHIIPVYEAGEAGGVLFIAMRWVAGGDVRLLLSELGPLPAGRVAAIVSPVASALDAAHAAGLVHRDVNPANMLVDRRPDRPDHVYLSDFGLSKGTLSSAGLTATGHMLGTPSYMAPEQIEGGKVDGRADQYALACAAFEMLVGEPPFRRAEGMAVAYAHLQAPPPALSSRRPDLPTAADQVLARALAKSAEDRYPTCRGFANALRAALGLAPYHATPATSPDRPADPGAGQQAAPATAGLAAAGTSAPAGTAAGTAGPGAAGAEALGGTPARTIRAAPAAGDPGRPGAEAAASGGAGSARRDATAEPVTAAATTGTDVASSSQAAPATEPGPEREEADGAARDQETPVTAVRTAASAVSATRPGPDIADAGPAQRPGRRRRLLATAGGIGVAAVAAVVVVLVNLPGTRQAPGSGPQQSRRPGHTTSGTGTGAPVPVTFSRIATLTTPLRRLTRAYAGQVGLAFRPKHPDALAVAYGRAYLWNVATGRRIATFTDPPYAYAPGIRDVRAVAFSPDGSMLATGDDNGNAYVWNVATGRRIATLTDFAHSMSVGAVAFSPDGSTLAAGDDSGSAYVWDVATGHRIATLTDPNSLGLGVRAVAFSPDGSTLAAGDDNSNAYVWNVATGRRIATFTDPNSISVGAVAFSPDGSMLAAGDDNGRTYVWDVATGRLIATLAGGGKAVAFSRTGNMLATAGTGSTTVWKYS